jgi:hypothetical protein
MLAAAGAGGRPGFAGARRWADFDSVTRRGARIGQLAGWPEPEPPVRRLGLSRWRRHGGMERGRDYYHTSLAAVTVVGRGGISQAHIIILACCKEITAHWQ